VNVSEQLYKHYNDDDNAVNYGKQAEIGIMVKVDNQTLRAALQTPLE
jgi:hypothetical protein